MFQEKTFPGITLCKLVEEGKQGTEASQTKLGSQITNKAYVFNGETD